MAYGQRRNNGPNGWRARFKRPDGTYGSKDGFSSETAAENWGNEQEALIRRNMWIDPRDAETPLGAFAEEWYGAVTPRQSPGTVAKYRSYLDNHLLPHWESWPVIGIFNSYVEIEKWVSELHEDYAESTVASIFATFSTILNAAVRARMIPANPCYGIRVTAGAFEVERLVASPVQGLRAAMRLYEMGMGLSGFTLCLADVYCGGRWSELVGQQRHEYDEVKRAIGIQQPLKEVNGSLSKGGVQLAKGLAPKLAGPSERTSRRRTKNGKKGGRTKTPAGTRWVQLPPSIAVFYEALMASHDHSFIFTSPEGHPLRRSNFRQRFWRPAWDGVDAEDSSSSAHIPAILPWFTFHEGRHTHSTWLAEDGIPEVARRARLGQKMKGMARVYDHVTPAMLRQILDALEQRWQASLLALKAAERRRLADWFPHLDPVIDRLLAEQAEGAIAQISPKQHDGPAPPRWNRAI